MAIRPLCEKCGKELDGFGAILLSPPEGKTVQKFHLCRNCYRKLVDSF